MYWTVYNWRQLISGKDDLEKSWPKWLKIGGTRAEFNKSWLQQDEENSGCWKYTKMLKSKLKTNQIQVITGEIVCNFMLFSMWIAVNFQVSSTKKLLTNINLTLSMRTRIVENCCVFYSDLGVMHEFRTFLIFSIRKSWL